MACYVYIIQSTVDGSYYKGISDHPVERLCQHNAGETRSTRHLAPWKLVYVEAVVNRSAAMAREKSLKRATRHRIAALLVDPKNIVGQFIK